MNDIKFFIIDNDTDKNPIDKVSKPIEIFSRAKSKTINCPIQKNIREIDSRELHYQNNENQNNENSSSKSPDIIFLRSKPTQKSTKKIFDNHISNNININYNKRHDSDLIKILNAFIFIIFLVFIVCLNILCLFALPYFFQESLSISD
jgi:hypothetical protein